MCYKNCYWILLQVLPIGHMTENKKQFRIVNPQAVDLEKYISKVEKAEQQYTRLVQVLLIAKNAGEVM